MDEPALPKPGRMIMEVCAFMGGGVHRYFLIYGHKGNELFSARLIEGESQLVIGWTASLGAGVFLNRIKRIRELLDGADTFHTISGSLSDRLRSLLRQRRLNFSQAELLLNNQLGGRWTIQVLPKKLRNSQQHDLVATQIGDDND